MLKEFEEVADGAKSVIQVFALGLISILFVGLPLAIGGRPEALVPLALGGMAAWHLRDWLARFQRTRRR